MSSELNDCGCCQGIKELTPVQIENPPGISALSYRVGTYSRFKASMHASLSSQTGIHKKLTTRADDDLSYCHTGCLGNGSRYPHILSGTPCQ